MSENYWDDEIVRVPWSSSDLILIFVLTLTLVFGLGELLNLVVFNNVPVETREALIGLFGTLLQDVLLIGLSVFLIGRRYGVSFRKMFFRVNNLLKVLAYGFIGGIVILLGVLLVNLMLAILLMKYFQYSPPQQRVITLLMESKEAWLFTGYAILIVLVAPVVEELFFRGLIYSYFRCHYGVRTGVFASAVFFGLVHMSAWAFAGTFLGGAALAYLYERTKSLYTSILAHMVWNGIVTGLLYLAWRFSELPVQ